MIGMSACLRATRLWLSLATRRTRMNNRFWGVVVELRSAGVDAIRRMGVACACASGSGVEFVSDTRHVTRRRDKNYGV
jgi:hypothetical protein